MNTTILAILCTLLILSTIKLLRLFDVSLSVINRQKKLIEINNKYIRIIERADTANIRMIIDLSEIVETLYSRSDIKSQEIDEYVDRLILLRTNMEMTLEERGARAEAAENPTTTSNES